jgi:hypothetical protein
VYQAPELQYVGSADEVILGISYVGGDLCGQDNYVELEFEED